jgi:hypothetical protein
MTPASFHGLVIPPHCRPTPRQVTNPRVSTAEIQSRPTSFCHIRRWSGLPSNGASMGIDGSVRNNRTSVIAPILRHQPRGTTLCLCC